MTGYVVSDEPALRQRYRQPHPAVVAKVRPQVDPAAAAFLAAAPLVVLATTSPTGTDASPRGGLPGFVKLIDPHHIAFADLSGNNRLSRPFTLEALVPALTSTLDGEGPADAFGIPLLAS